MGFAPDRRKAPIRVAQPILRMIAVSIVAGLSMLATEARAADVDAFLAAATKSCIECDLAGGGGGGGAGRRHGDRGHHGGDQEPQGQPGRAAPADP
jgi:hypothetical protein